MFAMCTVPLNADQATEKTDQTTEKTNQATIAKIISDAGEKMDKDLSTITMKADDGFQSAGDSATDVDSDNESSDSGDGSEDENGNGDAVDKKTQTEKEKRKKKKSGANKEARAALRKARKEISDGYIAWASEHNNDLEKGSLEKGSSLRLDIRSDGTYLIDNPTIDKLARTVGDVFGYKETLETLVNDNDLSENSVVLNRRMAIVHSLLADGNVALAKNYAELCSNENELPVNIFGHFKHVLPKAGKKAGPTRGTLTTKICDSIIKEVAVAQKLCDQKFITSKQLEQIIADTITKSLYPDGIKEDDKVYTIDEIREADDRFKAARSLRRKQKRARSDSASPETTAKRTKI